MYKSVIFLNNVISPESFNCCNFKIFRNGVLVFFATWSAFFSFSNLKYCSISLPQQLYSTFFTQYVGWNAFYFYKYIFLLKSFNKYLLTFQHFECVRIQGANTQHNVNVVILYLYKLCTIKYEKLLKSLLRKDIVIIEKNSIILCWP